MIIETGFQRSCGKRESTEETSKPTQMDTVITFFYLVNETGKDIKVKVLADDKEVFITEIKSQPPSSAGAQQAAPENGFPARELKVDLSKNTKHLEIQELNSNLSQHVDITNFSQRDGGFRIIARAGKILFSQDYFPVR
jgi:hypothetical protein